MKKILAVLIVIGGLSAAAYFIALKAGPAGGASADETRRFFTVKAGDLAIPVTETGVLKAKNSTRISSKVEREVKIVFLAKEGSRVKKGEDLVKFDPTEIDREIENEKQNIDAAKAQFEASKVDYDIQKTDWDNEIARAKLSLEEAEKNYDKYEKGDLPLKDRENRIKLEEAEANLKRAREKLEQMPELLKEGFVTPDQVEQKKLEVKKAEVAWESAKSDLDLFEKYTKPLEIEKKKAELDGARTALESARKRIEAKSKQKDAEISSIEVNLKERAARLEHLQKQRLEMDIKAPTDGLVIYGEPGQWYGGNEIKVGTQVWMHQTIITLPDLSEMQATLRIHEMDIGRIRKDMEVTVTVEAAGSKSFPGRITKIAELANAGGWRSDPEVKQFDIEVTLDGRDLMLKPGTTAEVEIVIVRLEGVLYVPIRAVRGIGPTTFCYANEGGELRRKTVEIGLGNDKFVEIKSGLSEGDVVLVENPPTDLVRIEEADRQRLASEKRGHDSASASQAGAAPGGTGGSGKKED